MALPSLANQTVYRLRGVYVEDEWHDTVINWDTPDRLMIRGCSFQPQQGDEFNESRDAIVTRWSWLGPPNADVKSDDRIEFKGIAYEVDGSVTDPEGVGLDHKAAVCKRVEG